MQLVFRKLYGRFDYEFDFNHRKITILTGPNGYGKSTILHCIQALKESNIYFFACLEFEEIKVFSKGLNIEIKKINDTMYINNHPYEYKYENIDILRNRYASRKIRHISEDNENMQQDMQDMASVAENVKLINEQRLIKEITVPSIAERDRVKRNKYVKAIEEIPVSLAMYINQTASNYTEVVTKLDSSFPYRILNNKINSKLDEDKFNELYEDMKDKLEKLSRIGIVEKNDDKALTFSQEDARVLEIFFSDFGKKYNVYEPLLKKISLFLDILNKRFSFKNVQISDNWQLIVVDEDTKEQIPLTSLSSGEQEIIILFYRLIFESEENTMVLIDEPEISLHIVWQMMFIDDLRKIVELNKLCTVIATHSPDIIGGNRDIQIDLGEMYNNGLNH